MIQKSKGLIFANLNLLNFDWRPRIFLLKNTGPPYPSPNNEVSTYTLIMGPSSWLEASYIFTGDPCRPVATGRIQGNSLQFFVPINFLLKHIPIQTWNLP